MSTLEAVTLGPTTGASSHRCCYFNYLLPRPSPWQPCATRGRGPSHLLWLQEPRSPSTETGVPSIYSFALSSPSSFHPRLIFPVPFSVLCQSLESWFWSSKIVISTISIYSTAVNGLCAASRLQKDSGHFIPRSGTFFVFFCFTHHWATFIYSCNQRCIPYFHIDVIVLVQPMFGSNLKHCTF